MQNEGVPQCTELPSRSNIKKMTMTDLNNQNTTLESSNRLFESFEKDHAKKSYMRVIKESLNTEYADIYTNPF